MVFAGQRVSGTLELGVPREIPRAQQVELDYLVSAWAGYGSGKNRSVVKRNIFHAPLQVAIPEGVLSAGTHHYPFAIDAPPWLPPAVSGNDCGIQHTLTTRLDVDWAIDPKGALQPALAMVPQEAMRVPFTTRSHATFHESIVLEVTLASSVVSQDEPLSGLIALRSGLDARFDAISLSFVNVSTITMGRGDRRRTGGRMIRLPAAVLRTGDAVPFLFPPDLGIVPTFRNRFFDNDAVLVVTVEIPWASDPEIAIPIHVLPAGSRIHGEGSVAPVGSARLRQSAALLARQMGLEEGRPPVLVDGRIGPISLRVVDAPREGHIGIDAELGFPDVELGTTFRACGLLDGFRDSPLLPPELHKGYVLRCEPNAHAPKIDDAARKAFFATVLAGLARADELHLSDHHLGLHFSLADDDGKLMSEVGRFLRAKAETIADAIAHLPYPLPLASSGAAWQAVAAEQSAFLVPTGPSLHGLSFGTQLLDGEQRTVGVSIRTVWSASGPATRVEVDLRESPVPEAARSDLEEEGGRELARNVRAVFPEAHVHESGATLDRPGFTDDPRTLFAGIEMFLSWVLEARGERRADAPYR